MHCFPVQCRIHIHVVRVFVSARVYYVGVKPGEGGVPGGRLGVGGGSGGGCPVMSGERTDNEALLDYTDLFGPGRAPVRISIKNFKLQARLRERARLRLYIGPIVKCQPSRDARRVDLASRRGLPDAFGH